MNMDMSAPALLTTSSRRANEGALKAALAANDPRRICKAIDAAVLANGFAKVAEEAKVDRTTIYRAFRREYGPALDTMVKVLHVLGLRLIVEIKPSPSSERARLDVKTTARSLTRAFRSGDLDFAIEALAKVLRSQENVSEFVRTAAVSRENLYRSFAFPHIPRFRTALNFLNALGLQFGIERLPSKNRVALRRLAGPRVVPNGGRSMQSRPDDRARDRSNSRKGRRKSSTP